MTSNHHQNRQPLLRSELQVYPVRVGDDLKYVRIIIEQLDEIDVPLAWVPELVAQVAAAAISLASASTPTHMHEGNASQSDARQPGDDR